MHTLEYVLYLYVQCTCMFIILPHLIVVDCRDYPLLLVEEYMNQGDLLGVLKDCRPSMPLLTQLDIALQVADAMDYLATGL